MKYLTFKKLIEKVVNSFLYRSLNKHVTQDYNYRWKLIEKNKIENESFSKNDKDHKTDLSNLCNYYLSCLGYDEAGVSLSVKSKMDNQFFFETQSIPDNENIHEYEENLRLLSARKRTEIGRHELFFGYPSFINKIFLIKENFTKINLEPLILFQVDFEDNKYTLNKTPIINQKAFRNFTKANKDELMSRLGELEAELGFTDDTNDVDIDEVVLRLQHIRPEWDWVEKIDPNNMFKEKIPLEQINRQGIYNRGFFF